MLNRRQNDMTRSTLLLAPVLALAFAGCGPKHEQTKQTSTSLPVALVRVGIVENKPRPITEEVVGTVRAKLHATLEAKISARIDKLPLALGQRVKAGELAAHLVAGEINARLDEAQSTLEQAERDWKRATALFEQQAMTRADYEAAQSRFQAAKSTVAEAKAMLGYVELVVPFDGVVTAKWAEVGDLAAPGKPLIALEDPSALQLEADLPQAIASRVQQGAQLAVRVDGVDQPIAGTVSEIAPAGDSVSRTVQVKLDLPTQSGLGSGQFARLIVPLGETSLPHIPASAVVQRGQLEIVFVVENQHALLHLVKTGQRSRDELEILSGLHVGESVVVDGAAQLSDGQPVEAK